MLVLLAPVLLVVAVLLVLDDGWPVFYRQVRVGEGGRPFRLTKLPACGSANPAPR